MSGDNPGRAHGLIPKSFGGQAQVVSENFEARRPAAKLTRPDMGRPVFLSDRRFGDKNRDVLRQMFHGHGPASPVRMAGIDEEAWLLEFESSAAD